MVDVDVDVIVDHFEESYEAVSLPSLYKEGVHLRSLRIAVMRFSLSLYF